MSLALGMFNSRLLKIYGRKLKRDAGNSEMLSKLENLM